MVFGGAGASHAHVASAGSRVMRVWSEIDGENSEVVVMQYADAGTRWSNPVVLDKTTSGPDTTFQIRSGNNVFVSLATGFEGSRIVPLDPDGIVPAPVAADDGSKGLNSLVTRPLRCRLDRAIPSDRAPWIYQTNL